MLHWDLMLAVVPSRPDLFTVGENVQHMVIKLFTWQVPMRKAPPAVQDCARQQNYNRKTEVSSK